MDAFVQIEQLCKQRFNAGVLIQEIAAETGIPEHIIGSYWCRWRDSEEGRSHLVKMQKAAPRESVEGKKTLLSKAQELRKNGAGDAEIIQVTGISAGQLSRLTSFGIDRERVEKFAKRFSV